MEVLHTKQPEARPPTVVSLYSYLDRPLDLVPFDITDDTVMTVVGRASGCLVCRTSISVSPVFVHRFTGYSLPPVSLSVIHCTSVCSFPRSTRL